MAMAHSRAESLSFESIVIVALPTMQPCSQSACVSKVPGPTVGAMRTHGAARCTVNHAVVCLAFSRCACWH
eukprot:4108437-Alexandrium_andersonii.AAC.1